MYRDKDRQREANRQASKRYRARKKGMTQGITKRHTHETFTGVIPEQSYNPIKVGYVPKISYEDD